MKQIPLLLGLIIVLLSIPPDATGQSDSQCNPYDVGWDYTQNNDLSEVEFIAKVNFSKIIQDVPQSYELGTIYINHSKKQFCVYGKDNKLVTNFIADTKPVRPPPKKCKVGLNNNSNFKSTSTNK